MTASSPRISNRLTRFAAPLALAAGLAASVAGAQSEVADSPTDVRPLLIGSDTPSAAVQTLDGKDTDLRDLLLGKKSVLIFYRGGW